MKRWFIIILIGMAYSPLFAQKTKEAREILEIKIYHSADSLQLARTKNYLKTVVIPKLHHLGKKNIGVFSALDNDTASDKRFYVIASYPSLQNWLDLNAKLSDTSNRIPSGSAPGAGEGQNLDYKRIETILLTAFDKQPFLINPHFNTDRTKRIYELRSYESSSEALLRNKVDMFNGGGEVDLFRRLNFNAIFYGSVIAGNKMPNLMYMTSFKDKEDRELHWKTFGNDPFWKQLSARPEYQNNVSHIDITFLMAEEFSDL